MLKLPRMNFQLSGREQIVFYAMIALTVIALISTATFRQRTTESMVHIANSNRVWNGYLDLLLKLEVRAGAVNAPGNDVFDSRNVPLERAQFREQQAQFDRDLGALQYAVSATMTQEDLPVARVQLQAVKEIESRMAASSETIFDRLESGRVEDAAKAMAIMDKHYADLRAALQELRMKWSGVEAGYEAQQMDVIDSTKNLNSIVMAVNLLFILGLVFSGHRIFHRLRASEHELIEARNEAVRAGQVKANFIANISHEIRTPINGIMGMARLLADVGLTREASHHVQTIRRCGTTLLALINDVLLFSKMESARVTLQNRPFDIRRAVEDVRELLSAVASEKGLALSCRLDPVVPRYLVGDDTRFRQVLMNLVGNAIKFTDRGSVVIDVSATPVGGNRYDVRMAVVDTGIGIAPEAQGKLFQAFYQVRDGQAADRMGGTGLGLAICRAICEAMGGTIKVQSEVGRGTTFVVYFRAEGVADVSTIPSERPAAVDAELGARCPLRLLLVEDNATNQVVTVQFLAKIGYRTDVAADGQEALEMIARRAYDLILMDCRMPRMDGFEATKRIRERQAGGHRPVIVALTASAFEEDRNKCLAAGMDDVLAKPVDLEVLQRMIAKWGGAGELSAVKAEAVEPILPPAGSQGPVDVAVLLNGFAGMERNLASGIATFLNDMPGLMSRICNAMHARDTAALCEAAHALSGTAAMFRAATTARLCSEIERSGLAGNFERAAALYPELGAELEQVRAQMALLKVHCQTIASETPVQS